LTFNLFRAIFIQDGRKAVLKTMSIVSKIKNYFSGVKMEMRKVNLPTRQETVKYTLIVIGLSAAVAIFLGGLDFLFAFLISKFLL
jgi:preprotein translocase subunit SecE